MKLPPNLIGAVSPYVNPLAIARIATRVDINQLGADLDAAMVKLATKMDAYCRDEVVLGLLTVAETAFYLRGWRSMSYDALVAAALDHTVSQYPDTKAYDRASLGAVKVAGPWLRPAIDYHALVGGLINVAQERMQAIVTHDGRMVFVPACNLEAELRNRWFAERWQRVHHQRGVALITGESALRSLVPAVDKHVAAQKHEMTVRGIYKPPSEAWYVDVVDAIAEKALEGQFADIAQSESWGGMSKTDTIRALTPLYRAAARRVFATQRAFRYLRDVLGAESPLLVSVVEVARIDDLVAAAATASGLSKADAEALIRSMVRMKGEEREGVLGNPLVPMHGDRIAYMPSAVLFSAWPAQQQQAVARRKSNSISAARENRHVTEIVGALHTAGYGTVAVDVLLVDPSTGKHLTDLDVVAVSDDLTSLLIVQLKSYLTPSNLLDVRRADRDVAKARQQCVVAENQPSLVTATVEQRFGIKLQAGYAKRQLIVVEAIAAVDTVSPIYPVVSIEWLVDRLRHPLPHGLLQIWEDARFLPDAEDFVDSVAPAFELFDDKLRDLKLGRSLAVFAYDSKRDV